MLLLCICASLRAQEKPNAACPTLEVTGPAGITAPGGVMPFVLTVSDPTLRKLSFEWKVSAGTIVEGQRTRVIKVTAPSDQSLMNITATVTVKGLADGCSNEAAETAGMVLTGDPTPVDTYGRLPTAEEKVRLAYAFGQLARNPNLIAIIIIRTPNTKLLNYNSRVRTITGLLRMRISSNKYVFANGGLDDPATIIYLIPPKDIPIFSKQ
jgi:hypothetical protein